jgi:hypothetical protein
VARIHKSTPEVQDIGRQFQVVADRPGLTATLDVSRDEGIDPAGGVVSRTLMIGTYEVGDAWKGDYQTTVEDLPSLRLSISVDGQPTVYLGDDLLTESSIGSAFVGPLIEAAASPENLI